MYKKIGIAVTVVLIFAVLAYMFIGRAMWSNNINITGESKEIFVPGSASFEDVVKILNDSSILNNEATFRTAASLMRYNKEKVPAGRYEIVKNWTNQQLISKLRSGNQDAQNVVINNIRTLYDLAGKAARYFETDSIGFLTYLKNPTISSEMGYSQDDFLTMFIPNTYEMFWTTTPEKFVPRMKKEHDTFWTAERENKIKQNNLDKKQAYIVASIVEKESNYDPERPTIAGVYLNRLKAGEKLQADPTVVFSTGDFSIQRVLYSHLETDSPYNTYKYTGLPPGPICMPSIASLEAVINAENHEYMFFCAKADNSGIHVFAKDYSSHLKNAEAFANWLNSLNIK